VDDHYQINRTYSVQFIERAESPGEIDAHWTPAIPKRLATRDWETYQAALLDYLARRPGGVHRH